MNMNRSSRNLIDLQTRTNANLKIPIPKTSWKTRVGFPLLLLGTTLGLFLWVGYETLIPSIPVQVAPVVPKQVQGSKAQTTVVQAAGWVEADPYLIHITALTDGIVQEVYVLEGSFVKKGQLLVQMIEEDARLELRRAEAILLNKQAELELAQAEERSAQIQWAYLTERKRALIVAKAQVEETKAMIKKANADVLAEHFLLKKAESDYVRTVPLIKENAASKADLVESETLYLAQKAKWESATHSLEILQETLKRLEAEAEASEEVLRLKNEEQRILGQAQAKIKMAQASITLAEAERDEKKLQLQRMRIESPVDGVVVKRYVEPGSKILKMADEPHSMHLFSLYDPKRLQIRVDVPLADVAFIEPQQLAEVVVEVLPDTVFSGHVTRLIHEANIQKNTLEVKVALENPRSEIRPEMLARVKFLAKSQKIASAEEIRESLFVRIEAIQSGTGKSFLWVLKNYDGRFGTATKREIHLGPSRQEGWIELLEGVYMGDLTILNPPETLKEGTRLRVDGERSF